MAEDNFLRGVLSSDFPVSDGELEIFVDGCESFRVLLDDLSVMVSSYQMNLTVQYREGSPHVNPILEAHVAEMEDNPIGRDSTVPLVDQMFVHRGGGGEAPARRVKAPRLHHRTMAKVSISYEEDVMNVSTKSQLQLN